MRKRWAQLGMVLMLAVVLMLSLSAKAVLIPVDGDGPFFSAVGFPLFWLTRGPFSLSLQVDCLGLLFDLGFWSLVSWLLLKQSFILKKKAFSTMVCAVFTLYLLALVGYLNVFQVNFGRIEWSKIYAYGPGFGLL